MPFNQDTEVNLEIGPLRLHVGLGTMPPDEIRLWEENPRIQHLVARLETFPTQEDLVSCISRAQPNAYRNLFRDIEKFSQQEPVFLRGDWSTDPIQIATAVEGNTRVAILQQLHDRHPDDPRFKLVKAYLLPEDFPENDLAILMANFHVKGTLRNQWDRYQIGAFLYDQIDRRRRFSQSDLAEHIGKSQSWVSRHLTIYKFALEFKDEIESNWNVSPGDAEEEVNRYFSILEEAHKVKAFREEWEQDIAAKETLFRWVHEGKFKDHRKVRGIYEIYKDPVKRQQVEDGEFGAGDVAADRLGKSVPLHDELDRLVRRIETIQLGDLTSVDRNKVRRVVEALENLEGMIERLGGAAS